MKKAIKSYWDRIPKIDTILNKFISKKLTVFVIATIFMSSEKILGDQWVNVALIYIGSQAAIDAVVALRQ